MGFRNKSLHYLKNKVLHLIEIGEIDRPLRLIHDFVERIITEPLCTSQIYGSKDLDYLCQRIGEASLEKIKHNDANKKTSNYHRPVYAYIVTKLQNSGGHSRLIEDFIKARQESQHIIISTGLAGKSDADSLLRRLGNQDSVVYEAAPKNNFQNRLTWLQTKLLEIHPNKVYLFNHHPDSVAVAAIQPEMGVDAYFYHHGDHHLCLGVYLSYLKHIDPHPMGYRNCRDVLGIENIYVPLTVGDRGDRPQDRPFLDDSKLTTCTAARSNKIEIPYFISYLDIVPQIIKNTSGKHIHIGRLSPWALYRIRRGLKRYGVQQDRFVYTPWVPSVWNALHDYGVDLYIASFPYGGGLTLIEAMGAGIPVALHRHLYSRVLSGIDLAYPDAFNWRFPNELLEFCSNLTGEYLELNSRRARNQYLTFHRPEYLEQFLSGKDSFELTPGELKGVFAPEYDEWAYWMERQISFKRIVQRGAYRIFRSIRDRHF